MAYTGRAYDRSQIQWAAGTVAVPLALAGYETTLPSKPVEKTVFTPDDLITGVDQPTAGYPAARHMEVNFRIPLASSPTDDAPYLGALLRACGCSEASGGSGTGNVAYLYRLARNHHPLTDSPAGSFDPVDLVVNYDRLEYELDSCAGNCRIEWSWDNLVYLNFTFRGLVDSGVGITASAATEAAAESLTASDTVVAALSEGVSVKIGSAAALTDLEIPSAFFDFGNILGANRSLNGGHGYGAPYISGRLPLWGARFLTRELTNYNFPSALTARSKLTIEGTHNSAGGVGSTIRWGWKGYINQDVDLPDEDRMLYYDLAGKQSELSGDEFYIGWESSPDHTYPFD